MPNYKCDICNYNTYRLPDAMRHKKTKKHLRNMQKHGMENSDDVSSNTSDDLQLDDNPIVLISNHINSEDNDENNDNNVIKINDFSCKYCHQIFKHYQSLWRHEKYRCKNNDKFMAKSNTSKSSSTNNKDNKIGELIQQNNLLLEQNKKLLDLAANNSHASIINAEANVINAKSTKKSMNMMSHAMKHWANAPPMKVLEGKEAMKLITYENKSKSPIEEVIIHQFNSNTLERFLGNVLIKEFKKEDQLDQSLWTTDSSRLCFIIKQIVGDTGSDRWVSDKSGIEITKLLISPLVKRVSEMMSDYVSKFMKEMKENIDSNEKKAKIAIEKIYDAETVIRGIVKNDLRKEILKYIAPYFNVDVKNIEIHKV